MWNVKQLVIWLCWPMSIREDALTHWLNGVGMFGHILKKSATEQNKSMVLSFDQWIVLRENLQESPMIFMGKSMVSCRFSQQTNPLMNSNWLTWNMAVKSSSSPWKSYHLWVAGPPAGRSNPELRTPAHNSGGRSSEITKILWFTG